MNDKVNKKEEIIVNLLSLTDEELMDIEVFIEGIVQVRKGGMDTNLKVGDICQVLEGDSNTQKSREHHLISEVGELVTVKEVRPNHYDFPIIITNTKNIKGKNYGRNFFCKKEELKLIRREE